jgi:hypothetical protein
MIEVTEAGKVIYKTEHNAVGRFPEPGDEELAAGPSRNFQVFDPLDFLAEVTQHIPNAGEHLIRYYGWYSNKSRGRRAKRSSSPQEATAAPPRPPTAREARKGWAALIKQVYDEQNPPSHLGSERVWPGFRLVQTPLTHSSLRT